MANKITNVCIVIFIGSCLTYAVYAQNVNCSATGVGRFPVPLDATCQNYTYCVRATNGTFYSYNYVCPTNSVFNPNSAQCTNVANYICTVAVG